jgi:thioredoxin-like negative regulator of GroEL
LIVFRAPWCRACKGLEPKYKQVAHKYPKAISFKQLNWEDNRDFCKTIGVTALPLVKFFTRDGEVRCLV